MFQHTQPEHVNLACFFFRKGKMKWQPMTKKSLAVQRKLPKGLMSARKSCAVAPDFNIGDTRNGKIEKCFGQNY